MAIERTLSIIKPDAVAKNVIGQIYSRFESNNLKIVASKMKWLSRQEAELSTLFTVNAPSSKIWLASWFPVPFRFRFSKVKMPS